jgi:hypothetical protein
LACVNFTGAALCEVRHNPSSAPALWVGWQQPVSSEGRIDEDSTDGVLVVQVRRLGAIYRDVLQLAARKSFVTARERIRTRPPLPQSKALEHDPEKHALGLRPDGCVAVSLATSAERVCAEIMLKQ